MIERKNINHVDFDLFGAEIAKKRYRIFASIIDIHVYIILTCTIAVIWGTPSEDDMLSYSFTGLPTLGVFLLGIFLWPISEWFYGQTIGKRIVGLHVVSDDYKPISFGQAFVRSFLWILDYSFFIGLIIVTFNK